MIRTRNYLLDTCVLLWALDGAFEKIACFPPLVAADDQEVYVSVVSYWEIIIKKNLGKLNVPDSIFSDISQAGFIWLNLIPEHISIVETLPNLHTDPFDRLLIAQAKHECFTLLTTDKKVRAYF